ncbi:carbamoyltransferase [Streptomyces sp. NRRL S-244]|uniref:carbamoyltransferase family protein n=1 Tax=Streptomyces sp. NRRL S-244 TaxID=1463897 RepID=UPI0004C16039|nr:carbamoyltransferase C-terminal domain-containing protein [Streptomyces sp. NRRL S-244]
MKILGINAIFHDPAAALVVDGEIVTAQEEERLTRKKARKTPVPFNRWEIPELAVASCLADSGLRMSDLDAVVYSYEPSLVPEPDTSEPRGFWEQVHKTYAQTAPEFLHRMFPDLDPAKVTFVPHHFAHAASAYLAAPYDSCAVLVLDGRGEIATHLAGRADHGALTVLASQQLPHSLGLLYEDVTEHLGFRRCADEYKVMALAAYGRPAYLRRFRERVRAQADGTFVVEPLGLDELMPRRLRGDAMESHHADLAASVQRRLEEVVLDLARWLARATGERDLAMAGGVAFNCVANSRVAREGPFERVWVQPAAGDAGTALGGALYVAQAAGDPVKHMTTAALGRGWSDAETEAWLQTNRISYSRPPDVAAVAARALADNKVVGWFQGRSEFGPRALGHRSILAHPGHRGNLERLNDIKGREQFRPVAPMVLLERATEIFEGPVPSPYMLFTHQVRPGWAERIPAALHVDGSARIQTIADDDEPLVARMLKEFERETGVPVVINTSFNVAESPIADHPRDAVACFATTPMDLLVLGPFILQRRDLAAG